jgi:DNA-binding beta-propeller fold protein YncE
LELTDLPLASIRQCQLIPHWSSGKPFSVLNVQTDEGHEMIGIPRALDLRRVTCGLSAAGVRVASPDPQIELLSLQTVQAARTPGWQLAHAGITGTQNVGASEARPLVLLGIVVGTLVLVFCGGGLLVLVAQSKKARQEEIARQPPAPVQRALPAAPAAVPQREREPRRPRANRATPPVPKPAEDQALVIKGGSSSPANSQSLVKPGGSVVGLAMNQDGSQIYVATNSGVVKYSAGSTEAAPAYRGHPQGLQGIELSDDGGRAVTFAGNELHVWNTDDLRGVARATGKISLQRAAISATGKLAAYSDILGNVALLDVEANAPHKLALSAKTGLNRLSFSTDGARLLMCGTDQVLMQGLDGSSAAQTIKLVGAGTQPASFTPDGALLGRPVSGAVETWDLSAGTRLASIPVSGLPGGVAVSADGKRLYGAADKDVIVADARSGQELYRLQGHPLAVTNLALSKDGKRLVTVSNWNQTIRLWTLPE